MTTAMRDELNARLPEQYVATIDQYIWIHEPEARQRTRHLKPDAYVFEESRRPVSFSGAPAQVEPATIVLPAVEKKAHKYVKIEDVRRKRVMTALELLSPPNKRPGDDREIYLAKRNEYLASRVSFVEIDLLRSGERMPLSTPPAEIGDYYVLVCRSWQYPRAGLWSFGVRDLLPEVSVPLDRDVAEVALRLRPCVDRVYDGGRFRTKLRYDQLPKPRMSKSDGAWVKARLVSHGKREKKSR
jgi:hypothetical protein